MADRSYSSGPRPADMPYVEENSGFALANEEVISELAALPSQETVHSVRVLGAASLTEMVYVGDRDGDFITNVVAIHEAVEQKRLADWRQRLGMKVLEPFRFTRPEDGIDPDYEERQPHPQPPTPDTTALQAPVPTAEQAEAYYPAATGRFSRPELITK